MIEVLHAELLQFAIAELMDQAIGANIFDSGSEDDEDAFPQRPAEPTETVDAVAELPAEGEDFEGCVPAVCSARETTHRGLS